MAPRWLWLLVFVCLGCHSVPGYVDPAKVGEAQALWEQGQDALHKGAYDQAIGLYERTLALDPAHSRAHLSLAAAYLHQNRPEDACPHLAQYVAVHPDHLLIRVHYADLLLTLHRLPEARTEYQRFLEDAQTDPDTAPTLLVRCHTRLVEIAQTEEDEYSEHLNRGIGLYILGTSRKDSPSDGDEELLPEALFCRAAAELKQAHELRPEEARPCWYLHEVWRNLDQPRQARRSLRQADTAAAFTFLTPVEQRQLHDACRQATP